MDLKKAKTICIVLLGIFAMFMLIMGITSNSIFGYIAIAVMGIYGLFLSKFWRCPKCDKNLGPLWVKCCPNCGEKIDN